MRLVDAGVDNRDLDSDAGVVDSSKSLPCRWRIDELGCAIQVEAAVTKCDHSFYSWKALQLVQAVRRSCYKNCVEKELHGAGD